MTSTDTLARLDPASAGDPRFDPHGPEADRVLAAAFAACPDTAPPARPGARGRPVLLSVAAGTAIAAVLVTAVNLTGSGGRTLQPAAAFAAAAERTAAYDSGVARIHTVVKGASGSVLLDARHDVRFSGDDSETSQHALSGAGGSLDGATWRFVDGRGWLRKAGAGWERIPEAQGDPTAHEARTILGDREQLVELVRHAEGVTRTGDTFRGTLDPEAVRALPRSPFGIGEIATLARIDLEMTLADDGTIDRLAVGYDSADGSAVTRTITLDALGEPQPIPAP